MKSKANVSNRSSQLLECLAITLALKAEASSQQRTTQAI